MTGFANRASPSNLGFHTFMTVDEAGEVTSVHQVPDEAFIHECQADSNCMCGPQIVMCTFHGEMLAMVRHAALDGDYYREPNGILPWIGDDLNQLDDDDFEPNA